VRHDVTVTHHRELAEAVGADLASRTDVLAVLITGSVGRGDHVPASDVDLLVVTANDHTLEPTRRLRDGLLVEWGARSEAEWLERFARPKSSWLYPFLEGQVIFDSGPAARLIEAARDTLGRYKTGPALKNELAVLLWHGRAKLDRAMTSGDSREQGFWASIVTPSLLDGLYAVHDVPLPAGSRRLSYLHLVNLDVEEQAWITQLLTGGPTERLLSAASLAERLREELGSPDLERF
jgi:predicted nucleotidyltransferase